MSELCTKKVPAPCENEATELLYVSTPGGRVEVHPRCPDHPAAGDVALIKRVSPSAVTRIVPVDAGADQ